MEELYADMEHAGWVQVESGAIPEPRSGESNAVVVLFSGGRKYYKTGANRGEVWLDDELGKRILGAGGVHEFFRDFEGRGKYWAQDR